MSATPRAADIHAQVGGTWPQVLLQLGVADSYLRLKKAGPCPLCGGQDRYTFDNRHGRGDYICRGCGAGDGFQLLERVHGWTFAETRRQVLHVISSAPRQSASEARRAVMLSPATLARPTTRLVSFARSACDVADCADAVEYLKERRLWPLPEQCSLRAHPGVDYWHERARIARYPALVASVRDVNGALVTVHVTYLEAGNKLKTHEPRKLLSPVRGRQGCAVRLMPHAPVLGIAEGIETALAAARLDGVAVWAALNASLLAKFEPPVGTERLRIYADYDEAGLKATAMLMERLQGRIPFEMRLPSAGQKDFNDELTRKASQ